MKYSNVEWAIGQLMELINSNHINLRPPYQRNFIWSSKDQKLLIELIGGISRSDFLIDEMRSMVY